MHNDMIAGPEPSDGVVGRSIPVVDSPRAALMRALQDCLIVPRGAEREGLALLQTGASVLAIAPLPVPEAGAGS